MPILNVTAYDMSFRVNKPAIACLVYLCLHVTAHALASYFEVAPGISLWYPPCGLAFALLSILGTNFAPVVFGANVLTALVFSGFDFWWAPLFFPSLITGVYTYAALVARRHAGPLLLPKNLKQALVLALTLLGAPALVAWIGSGSAFLLGFLASADVPRSALQWWIGDFCGLITTVPVVMVFVGPWIHPDLGRHTGPVLSLRQSFQLGSEMLVLLVCLGLVFASGPLKEYNAFYLCFIPLIWICSRWGLRGSTPALLLVAMGGLFGMHYSGSSLPLIVNFFLFQIAVALIALGLGISVNRQREAEYDRLENERKMLQVQKLESLGVLAGGVAHDFNNLLTTMLGNASLVRLDLPPSSRLHRNLEQIETAALRAAELCQQMLAYAGRSHLCFSAINLSQLIEQSERLLRLPLKQNTRLELRLAANLPQIQADGSQIRQVLVSLVTNSAEAIGDREGVVTLETTCRTFSQKDLDAISGDHSSPPGTYIGVEVKDNGCGMSSEVLQNIFDPFFTTKFAGRGLGLAAVQGIVKAHQGLISVQSQVGIGTSFTILFRTAPLPSPTAKRATPKSTRNPSRLVLLVDDEDSVRRVTARNLELLGFSVIEAIDGLNGLELFKQHKNELAFVVLDLTMPRLDGRKTFELLHAQNPEMPVILTSGFNGELSFEHFTNDKPAGFLQKPFSQATLKDCLDRLGLLQSPN